jgi:putative chitinase
MVKLSSNPNDMGAYTDDKKEKRYPPKKLPIKSIKVFEPESKMRSKEGRLNVLNLVAAIQRGERLPPIWVRRHGNGYQVLDGHHRLYAHKVAGKKTIWARIIPSHEIEIVDEHKIDNYKGINAVELNQEIDYFGIRVKMLPSVFLRLAAPLETEPNGWVEQHIANGGSIGSPRLGIAIPAEWSKGDFSKPATVMSHEGRNRMTFIQKLEGDVPVETHIFPYLSWLRTKDLTKDYVDNINLGLIAENSTKYIRGPLFQNYVSESLEEDWRKNARIAALTAAIPFGLSKLPAPNIHKSQPTAQQVQTAPAQDQKSYKVISPTQKTQRAVPNIQPITNHPREHIVYKEAVKQGLRGTELAQFMAQVKYESINFAHMRELGNIKTLARNYFNKKSLGNKSIKDAARFIGRGFIQITGRYNYEQAEQALGIPLTKHPELAEQPKIAAKIAVWFWKEKVKGQVTNYNDTTAVTSKINPALLGVDVRDDTFQSYMTRKG